jgi:hypothetical protein
MGAHLGEGPQEGEQGCGLQEQGVAEIECSRMQKPAVQFAAKMQQISPQGRPPGEKAGHLSWQKATRQVDGGPI